jgi:hypothetical protein
MSLTLNDIEWRTELPDIPDKLPMAILATPSYEERLHAIRTLHERFRLGDTIELDLPFGIAHAGERGEVQYFSASGAVRARDAQLGQAFPDERRQWTDVYEAGDQFLLGDDLSASLLQDAGELLRAARLLPDGLGDVDVVLDQWVQHDDAGAEIARGPGRAVVRAPYSVDGFPFLGAGAKTRLAYEPTGGRPVLARIFHVHRPIADVYMVHAGGTEQTLTGLLRDPFLAEQREGGAAIAVTELKVGLLTLPAVVPQRIATPALAVTGTVGGEPFARNYQAISAKALRKAGFAAAHVPY